MRHLSLIAHAGAWGLCLMAASVPAQTPPKRPLPGGPLAPISTTEPEYTQEARDARLQGSVILYLDISPAGDVEKIQTLQSLGMGLDEKAMEAVRQWRFRSW